MTADLNAKNVLCAAPKYDTDFVNLMQREKSTCQLSRMLSNNAPNINLSTTRTAMLLSPLALAACGGGEGDATNNNSSLNIPLASFQNFQPQSINLATPSFFTIHASDLNKDGKADFIISSGSFPPDSPNSFSLVLITSNFDEYVIVNTNFETKFIHPAEIATADFNNDGLIDVFVAASGYDTAPFLGEKNGLFFQNPDGSFSDNSSILPNLVDNTHRATIGDINNDGYVDIYVNNIFNNDSVTPYLLLNNGGSSFAQVALPDEIFDYASAFGGGNTKKYTSSLLSDVNSDGSLELILGMDSGSSSFVLNYNNSNQSMSVLHILPLGFFGVDTITLDIKAGDVNGDGRVDLIFSQTTSNPFYVGRGLQVLLQQENGDFIDSTASSNFSVNKPWLQTISLIDFDKDGFLDIVGTANAGGIYLFKNDGLGGFTELNNGNSAFSASRANIRGAISDELGTVYEIHINQNTLDIYQYV